jgi:hypothetical protein
MELSPPPCFIPVPSAAAGLGLESLADIRDMADLERIAERMELDRETLLPDIRGMGLDSRGIDMEKRDFSKELEADLSLNTVFRAVSGSGGGGGGGACKNEHNNIY